MPEQINHDYEVSSGCICDQHWEVPWARLTDTTPTASNPAELTSRTPGTQLTGTILTVNATLQTAIIDFTPGMIYYPSVRNVLTYNAGVEATWGAINIGDAVYYDNSATMPAGVYLSTSPLDNTGAANTLFGFVVPRRPTDSAAVGGATASTQRCAIMQRGAGS